MKRLYVVLGLMLFTLAGMGQLKVKQDIRYYKGAQFDESPTVPVATGDNKALPLKQAMDSFLIQRDTALLSDYISGADGQLAKFRGDTAVVGLANGSNGQVMTIVNNIPDWGNIRVDEVIQSLRALGSVVKYRPIFSMFSSAYTGLAMDNGILVANMIYIPKKDTLTGVKYMLLTAGAFTADETNGFALYKLVGTNRVLVAQTANDGEIWKATAEVIQTSAFTSTYIADIGIYYIYGLYHSSAETTKPTIATAFTMLSGWNGLAGNNRLSFYMSDQTTFTTPQANTEGSNSGHFFNLFLY